MQVVCGNCQLSFQAPDGATGLVCPICRSPLRAADAPPEAVADATQQPIDWNGGTLDELVSLLSAPAWSARVEVLPGTGANAIGEVHVIAGGVSEAIYDGKSTHDALDKLRAVKGARFRVERRLPNPSDGDLTFPGPDHGKLEERPLAHLMRYCEDYVLTAGIEVWRGSENAKVDYRRGEIVGVTVGGIDAPERLAEVMKWSSGNYRLLAPKLTLPETAPKAPAPAAVVAPRASGAASRTIFGMPALDPAAINAATDKVKAVQAQLQAKAAAPVTTAGAPGIPPASSPSAPAPAGRSGAVPAAAATHGSSPPEAASTPAAPRQSAAVARTMFGMQGPALTPPVAAVGTAASTAQASTSAAATTAPAAVPAKGTSATPSADPAKPSRATGPTTIGGRAQGTTAVINESDRTAPNKAAKEQPGETPVWTYVGVGFVFGLALLGVYRLVIVLAH